MAEKDKVFYWLKLKENFMTSDKVDFLMSQKNGASYVVLYQMLVIKTINTQGKLYREIGEIIIPFDVSKIQRDCKWFDTDTIIVALELYKKLGLVYQEDKGFLCITDFEELVGSETYWAERKRIQREKEELDKIQQQSNKSPKSSISNISSSNISLSNSKIDKKEKRGTYQNVLLTDIEYQKIIDMDNGQAAIDYLSEYIELKNYKAKSHYLAILKWVFNALKEQGIKEQELQQRENRLKNGGISPKSKSSSTDDFLDNYTRLKERYKNE